MKRAYISIALGVVLGLTAILFGFQPNLDKLREAPTPWAVGTQ